VPWLVKHWRRIRRSNTNPNPNADDLAKIRSVLEESRQDIIHKDGYALTKLVLNPHVLFNEIDDQKEVDSARKYNAQFDGIGPSRLDAAAKFFSTSKDKLEEKFRNIEICQDGPLGLVTFNYDFCHQRQGYQFRRRTLARAQN
jgi:hypothetical protein